MAIGIDGVDFFNVVVMGFELKLNLGIDISLRDDVIGGNIGLPFGLVIAYEVVGFGG